MEGSASVFPGAGLTKLIAGAMLKNSRELVEQAERK